MKEFVREDVFVDIRGKQYGVRELSLSQKIRLLSDVGEFIKSSVIPLALAMGI